MRNLTGLGEVLDFTLTTSEGSNRYFGGLSVPVNDWGTQIFFRFDEGDSKVVEKPVDRLDIESQVHSLEGGISHPIFSSLSQRLNLGLLLAIRENETSLLGQPFSFIPGESGGQTRRRSGGYFRSIRGVWTVTRSPSAREPFSIGMNALGATPENTPRFPDGEFLCLAGTGPVRLAADRSGRSALVLRGTAQLQQ